MSGYYLLRKGEFAYNKSYSVGFDFGSIKRLEKYDQGALSTLYICFALDRFDSDFIKHYFDSLKWYREIYMISAEGARNHGLLNVPTEDFFATLHTLPMDTAEQKKIAEFLDLLTAKIEKQQALVDTLKKYKRGLHKQIFTPKPHWSVKPLREIATFCGGGTPSKDISKYWQGSIGWISSSDVQEDWIDEISISRRITEEAIANSATKVCPKGTIAIISRVGVGKVAIMPENLCTSQDYTNITSIGGDITFFAYQIANKMKIEASKTQGTAIKGVTAETIKSMEIDIPDLDEQRRIATVLKKFDCRIKYEMHLLNLLQNTKSSLLQQLFI